jgi:uncharacterized protein (UPF0332 family)
LNSELEQLLQKAEEKLRVAALLIKEDAPSDAASRAYYAAFHAVTALHLSRGNAYSSHGQVIGRFNKDFVKTGVFPDTFTRILTRLFEDRQSADYDVADTLSQEDAERDVADSREIVNKIRSYLAEGSAP